MSNIKQKNLLHITQLLQNVIYDVLQGNYTGLKCSNSTNSRNQLRFIHLRSLGMPS
jgi:hypothetical protein